MIIVFKGIGKDMEIVNHVGDLLIRCSADVDHSRSRKMKFGWYWSCQPNNYSSER
jgi:hypothetical protein